MTSRIQSFTDLRIPLAAGLSMLAAVLHGGVTGAHFEEWFGYGLFFLVATATQFVWGGFLLLRYFETKAAQNDPFPRVGSSRLEVPYYWAGVLGNLLIAGMYFVTRTVGIPFFGPEAGEIEAWDAFGLITTSLELLLVALLLVMITGRRHQQT